MSEQQEDKRLDENLSRLLSRGTNSPTLSADAETRIIEQLRGKQAELTSEKGNAMDRSITLSSEPQFSAKPRALAASALLTLAVVALIAAFLVPKPQGPQPQAPMPSVATPQIPTFDAKGLAKRQLDDGTTVIAHRGTKYTIVGPRHLRLEQGDLYLIVAKSGEPFVIETSDGEVRATGTRFAVSVGGETSAAVSQGRVTLSNKSDKVDLRAGQQGTMRKGQRPQRQPAKRLSYLVSWAKEALAQDELLVEKTKGENGLIAVDPWGQETKLTLRNYDVDVYIEDGIARTTIDQTFFNHYPWNTEGTFYFPLPPDASVSRLAMYVNGQLNEGGMVERGRGQQIYNDILYQRRDPALLEMMEGNVFKMRIFPLEGRQEKRIFLSYTQKLDELYGTMRYWFPMDHTNSVAKKLSVRVRVKDAADKYDFKSSTHNVVAEKEGKDLVLSYDAEKVKPDQDFLLHLVPNKQQQSTRIATCENDGHKFVFGRFTPEIPGKVDTKPRQWIVLNDVSASRSKIDLRAQRYIVERLLAEADDDDSLTILNLNTRVEPAKHDFADHKVFVPIKDLRMVGFEIEEKPAGHPIYVWPEGKQVGGTNLQAGIEAVADIIRDEKPDNPHILYLGDGVATDGKTEVFSLVRAIPRGATFVGIGVGKKVDSLFLQSAADQTGGMFTTINPDEDIDWRVFDLIAALNTPRVTKMRVVLKDKDGKDLSASKSIAYPSSRSLSDGETLTVVARCQDELPAKIVCEGLAGTKPFRFETSLDDAKSNAEFIPRLWAKRHIDELTKSDMERKYEIIELSKQYYVVTPFTSLIVLEDDAMYEHYKVERGRKDHWALYQAPKQIEVVKEPIDSNRWNWWYGPVGEDEKIKAKQKPQTVQEIVDSVQVRINAPFYYWQPQRHGQSRFALYQLLDSHADPTRLLTYRYLVAARAREALSELRGTSSSASAAGADQEERKIARQRMAVPQLADYEQLIAPQMLGNSYFQRDGRFAQFGRVPHVSRRFRRQAFDIPMVVAANPMPSLIAASNSRSPLLPMIMDPIPNFARHVTGAFFTSEQFGTMANMPVKGLSRPELLWSFQESMGRRRSRLDQDIRQYNRQYGHWDESGRWGGYDSLDLGESAAANWYRGLEELLETDVVDEPVAPGEIPPSVNLLIEDRRRLLQPLMGQQQQGRDGTRAAIAWLDVYDRTLKSQPGTCSVLAADHLLKRKRELLEKLLTPEGTKELQGIEAALANTGKAAARLEDSGAFWSYQGWNYRPQPWSFQQPTVQVYQNYNWSFDLTRYAPALYSSESDILNEVIEQYSSPAADSNLSQQARKRIEAARRAISPVKLRFSDDSPEVLVASKDRFAMKRRTDMYLEEKMICDGENVLHLYDELGLAARRPATDLRLTALRQLAPHLIEPADWLAARFKVELTAEDDEGFTIELTPLGETEEDKDRIRMTTSVTADGRVRSKTLSVNGKLRLKLVYSYSDNEITARWCDKGEMELSKFMYRAEPLDADDKKFTAPLADYVVFDMPLRKPSFYAENLKTLGDDDVQKKIELKRHHALASIQELIWRRWGGTNDVAQQSLTEAFALMKQSGQKAKLGDLTLLGSAGVYNPTSVITVDKSFDDSNLLASYFKLRSSGGQEAAKVRDQSPDTLLGHMASFQAAFMKYKYSEDYDRFVTDYPDSPLLLAAAHYCSQWRQQPEAWLKLYKQPKWRGLALLSSTNVLKTDEHRRQFTDAFRQWYEEMSEEGLDIPITSQVVGVLKTQKGGKLWQTILKDKFERVKKSDRASVLLRFAEDAMSWGENEFADLTLKLARQKLAADDSLLGRLALAQTLWAGSRFKEALVIYDDILAKLEAEKIAPSPALLASVARLAASAGDHERAIKLEERALEAEHPYLPDLINLQAFRQRYNWLWQQYQTRISGAVSGGDKESIDQWFARAESAWQRWHEVDPDNFAMMQQMATLQMLADRKDESWLYLSTMIDQRPRDANSYYSVGQWYRGRSKLDEAQQWYGRAYEWDTANPRWLLERAQLLIQLDRKTEARKLFQQIVDGQWATGLQGYVDQAKNALHN